MSRQTSSTNHLKRAQTRRALKFAIREVKQAAHPEGRGIRASLTWLAGIAAGAAVAWRSIQAGRQMDADTQRWLEQSLPSPNREALASPDHKKDVTNRKKNPDSAQANTTISKPRVDPKNRVRGGLGGLIAELIKRFNEDEISTHAQALAFVGVLSLVPLLLCFLAALGFLIRDPMQAADYVRTVVRQALPGEQAQQAAEQFITQTNIVKSAQTLMEGKWLSIVIGVGSLFWAAISLFVSATIPMNAAWEVKETRSFVKLRLICLGALGAAGIFFLVSLGVTAGAHGALAWLGVPKDLPLVLSFFQSLFFSLLAAAVNMVMFVLLYRILPNAEVSWRAALFGGAISGVFWEIFKQLFAWYLTHFGNFNKAYGALGGIFLLVTCIYYSCLLLLIGAIICKMYHEHQEHGGTLKRPISSNRK